ncbi:MAG: hypothetical protein WB816_16675 [Methylocystis sp.]
MSIERLLFLITAVFVFLCLGFALIVMASNPAKRPNEQAVAPPTEIAATQGPTAARPVVAEPVAVDKDAARQRLGALIAAAPDYTRFFKRLKETFPVDYASALDSFATRLVESKREESVDFYVSEAVRLLRQSRGVLAAKAELGPLSNVFDVQLTVLRAIGEQDPRLCVAFLYGATDQDFARFAATRRPLVADMALTGVEAIANGQAKKIERASPTEADFKMLETALLAKGLGKIEIDALLDGKMPDPPLEDARMCAAGQTYLETLHMLPEATRLRIYGLAMELMARS